jgi:uncharacterized protein YndB with AHSA1/START domain
MESDLRPGGKWVMGGTGMGGRPFSFVGEYRKVEPPHLLFFTRLPDWQGDATDGESDEGNESTRALSSSFSTCSFCLCGACGVPRSSR